MAKSKTRVRKKRQNKQNTLGVTLVVMVVLVMLLVVAVNNHRLEKKLAEYREKEQILTEQLQTMVEPYGTIRSTLCSSKQIGDTLEVTLTAECVEEIGKTVPILTEELGGSPLN